MLCQICKREIVATPSNLGGLNLCPTCADRLAHTAPALRAACIEAADLLGRLWTPNAPTVAELALLCGRLQAVAAAAGGMRPAATWDAAESETKSWPDTSHGQLMVERKPRPVEPSRFTFWQEMGDPDDWYTWPVSGVEEP